MSLTEWPVVVVAACLISRDCRRGRRKVEVQPAPRMRKSTEEYLTVIGLLAGCLGDVLKTGVCDYHENIS